MSKDHTKKKNYSPASLMNKEEKSQSIDKRNKQCINGDMCNVFKSTRLGGLNVKGTLASCIRQIHGVYSGTLCVDLKRQGAQDVKKKKTKTMNTHEIESFLIIIGF